MPLLEGLEALVRLRWSVARGAPDPSPGVRALADRPSHLQPLAAAALTHAGLPGPPLDAVLAERSEGLLGSQIEGLRARTERWSRTLMLR